MNQIPNIEERCEHGVVAKYCFRCKRPDLAGPIPNIEEDCFLEENHEGDTICTTKHKPGEKCVLFPNIEEEFSTLFGAALSYGTRSRKGYLSHIIKR